MLSLFFVLIALMATIALPMIIVFLVFGIMFKVGKLIFKLIPTIFAGIIGLIAFLICGSGIAGIMTCGVLNIMAAGVFTILLISLIIGCIVYKLFNNAR